MKNMYLLLALCLGLLAGCKPADPQAFRIEKVLTPELMPLQGLTDPFRLEIKHPFLIVQNSEKLRDSIFHVQYFRIRTSTHCYASHRHERCYLSI